MLLRATMFFFAITPFAFIIIMLAARKMVKGTASRRDVLAAWISLMIIVSCGGMIVYLVEHPPRHLAPTHTVGAFFYINWC